jgi:hypothetical protein
MAAKIKQPTYLGSPGIILSSSNKTDVSSYDDKGVSFKGYSKSLINADNYRLDKQEEADINFYYMSLFNDTSVELQRVNQLNKDFYCTDLIINCDNNGSVIGTGNKIDLLDGVNGVTRLTLQEDRNRYWFIQIHFTVPILFKKGNSIYLLFSRAKAANEALGINFYGWEE